MIRALPDWPRPERVGRKEQLAVAAAGARLLYARGAQRVWLFGSIAKGRKLGVHSDFDFATEGLPPDRYLNSLGTLLQLLPLPVDLVEMESASEMFRERILTEGILLPDDAD
ncbi:MAG: nucleotidyltransferase domain-containing protein [Chthoniobacterales bacterium]|nr:nucleotidyltransferase domain-containing protein [Chthoniobacterales bacterium]